jgi:hypothetical protein
MRLPRAGFPAQEDRCHEPHIVGWVGRTPVPILGINPEDPAQPRVRRRGVALDAEDRRRRRVNGSISARGPRETATDDGDARRRPTCRQAPRSSGRHAKLLVRRGIGGGIRSSGLRRLDRSWPSGRYGFAIWLGHGVKLRRTAPLRLVRGVGRGHGDRPLGGWLRPGRRVDVAKWRHMPARPCCGGADGKRDPSLCAAWRPIRDPAASPLG